MIAAYCLYVNERLSAVFFAAMAMDFSVAVFFVEWAEPAERKLEELGNEVAQLKAAIRELKP